MKKILFLILFLILNSAPVSASETTLYFGSTEKIYDNTGNLTQTKTYLSAGNTTIVKTQTGSTPPVIQYLYSDHLGSTVLTTDNNGVKELTLQYYSYGSQINPISPIGQMNDKLYTGQRKDFSSDLYFYNARYYNPNIGNFISADKAQGPNRYFYVGNNPVNNSDPTGNCILGIIGSDCNLPSYARYATNEEQNQSASTVSNYGLQASLLGASAFLADQNIPVVSGISGSYAKAADEIITGSITNNSSLYTLGGMDLMTAVSEAYMAGVTAYGYASLGKSFYNYYLSPKINLAKNIINDINYAQKPVLEIAGPTDEGIYPFKGKDIKVPYHTSNIFAFPGQQKPVQYSAYVGQVDMAADYTRLPIAKDSLGCLVGSCLVRYDYANIAAEAQRTVSSGGYAIFQGTFDDDLLPAFSNTSFKLISKGLIPLSSSFGNTQLMGQNYVILQKNLAK